MSSIESTIINSDRETSLSRVALTWIGASVIAVPLGVLLHEFGHYLVYRAFGFEGAALHYSSSTYALERTVWQFVHRSDFAGAAATIPLWKVGAATAAGLVATCVVTLACYFYAARKSANPFVVALGVFAPVRFLSGIPTIPVLLAGRPIRAGTDEAHLAALTGIPLIVLISAGLLFLALVWIFMFRSIPRDHRLISVGGLVSGLALGFVFYFLMIGPRLLP